MADFDSARFRHVLGHFPTGVTVVTSAYEGEPVGITIGSFSSVSLEPPLVGFFPGQELHELAGHGEVGVVLRQHPVGVPGRAVLALRQGG